jgi:hypothetical protein
MPIIRKKKQESGSYIKFTFLVFRDGNDDFITSLACCRLGLTKARSKSEDPRIGL